MAAPIFQRTVVDTQGNVVEGAVVEVRNEATDELAPIFVDRPLADVKANPFTTDSTGFIRFFAAAGDYRIKATFGAEEIIFRFVQLIDTDELIDLDSVQTLENKTLTSPVITTPTGIVKGDVDLGNVDNTSDATKNSATANLTNKSISGTDNTLSNISNASLTNSSIVFGATSANLGSTVAAFNGVSIGTQSASAGVFTTLQSNVLQLNQGQIVFPATQSASANANTLDDYEEGTWTPIAEGSATAGIGTYSSQQGAYTKVGRMVTVWGRLGYSSHTGTGIIRIANFPFTASANYMAGQVAFRDNFPIPAGTQMLIQMNISEPKMLPLAVASGFSNASGIPIPSFIGDFLFSVTYFASA